VNHGSSTPIEGTAGIRKRWRSNLVGVCCLPPGYGEAIELATALASRISTTGRTPPLGVGPISGEAWFVCAGLTMARRLSVAAVLHQRERHGLLARGATLVLGMIVWLIKKAALEGAAWVDRRVVDVMCIVASEAWRTQTRGIRLATAAIMKGRKTCLGQRAAVTAGLARGPEPFYLLRLPLPLRTRALRGGLDGLAAAAGFPAGSAKPPARRRCRPIPACASLVGKG
jgi:hypothetical protein